ncbi:OTU domain-containing protein 4 [Eucyclogobius newberryi]|uniref:OTU domain-containing protein 4 n=1 Tax=Eucyclogobius newberryi TaxID=166745 RepID=UPI003B593A4F
MDGGGNMRSNEEKGAEKHMDDYLKSIGLQRKKIAKDGSCLFRAVAEQVLHSQSLHSQVRSRCVEFLRKNRKSYEAFIEGDFEEYLHKLRDPQQWVGEVEINALAIMYKRDFWIFQEPGKAAVNITANNFRDTVQLCFLNGNHYDSVYPISRVKGSAMCQSVLYELLYDKVFGVERNQLGVCQRPSKASDQLIDDGMGPCPSSEESDTDTLRQENGTCAAVVKSKGRGRGRQLSDRVKRSLNPTLLRNVEYDVWQRSKKAQQKMDFCIASGMQFNVGDRCQVKVNSTGLVTVATVKKLSPDNSGPVTVYSEELGELKVPVWKLRPPTEATWSTVVREKRVSNGSGEWEHRGRGRGKPASVPAGVPQTTAPPTGRGSKPPAWPLQPAAEERDAPSSKAEPVLFGLTSEQRLAKEEAKRNAALAELQFPDDRSFPALGTQSGVQSEAVKKKGAEKRRSLKNTTRKSPVDEVQSASPSSGDRPQSSTPPPPSVSPTVPAAFVVPSAPVVPKPNAHSCATAPASKPSQSGMVPSSASHFSFLTPILPAASNSSASSGSSSSSFPSLVPKAAPTFIAPIALSPVAAQNLIGRTTPSPPSSASTITHNPPVLTETLVRASNASKSCNTPAHCEVSESQVAATNQPQNLLRNQIQDQIQHNQIQDQIQHNQIQDQIQHNQIQDQIQHNQIQDQIQHNQIQDQIQHNQIQTNQIKDRIHHNQIQDQIHHNQIQDRIHHNQIQDQIKDQIKDQIQHDQIQDQIQHDQIQDQIHLNQIQDQIHDLIHLNQIQDQILQDQIHHNQIHQQTQEQIQEQRTFQTPAPVPVQPAPVSNHQSISQTESMPSFPTQTNAFAPSSLQSSYAPSRPQNQSSVPAAFSNQEPFPPPAPQSQTELPKQEHHFLPLGAHTIPLQQQLAHFFQDPLYPGFPQGDKGQPVPPPSMSTSQSGDDLPQDTTLLRFFYNLGIKAYTMPMHAPIVYLYPLQQAYTLQPRAPSRSPSPLCHPQEPYQAYNPAPPQPPYRPEHATPPPHAAYHPDASRANPETAHSPFNPGAFDHPNRHAHTTSYNKPPQDHAHPPQDHAHPPEPQYHQSYAAAQSVQWQPAHTSPAYAVNYPTYSQSYYPQQQQQQPPPPQHRSHQGAMEPPQPANGDSALGLRLARLPGALEGSASAGVGGVAHLNGAHMAMAPGVAAFGHAHQDVGENMMLLVDPPLDKPIVITVPKSGSGPGSPALYSPASHSSDSNCAPFYHHKPSNHSNSYIPSGHGAYHLQAAESMSVSVGTEEEWEEPEQHRVPYRGPRRGYRARGRGQSRGRGFYNNYNNNNYQNSQRGGRGGGRY